MRIVVAGRLAAAPGQGGATWAVLQYVHGFAGLGHDVLLLEPAPRDDGVLAYFAAVTKRHGLVVRTKPPARRRETPVLSIEAVWGNASFPPHSPPTKGVRPCRATLRKSVQPTASVSETASLG